MSINQYAISGNHVNNYTATPLETIHAPLWFHKRNLLQTSTGCGSKLSTEYKVKHEGKWKRVYTSCFSNCGTSYILKGKEKIIVEANEYNDLPEKLRAIRVLALHGIEASDYFSEPSLEVQDIEGTSVKFTFTSKNFIIYDYVRFVELRLATLLESSHKLKTLEAKGYGLTFIFVPHDSKEDSEKEVVSCFHTKAYKGHYIQFGFTATQEEVIRVSCGNKLKCFKSELAAKRAISNFIKEQPRVLKTFLFSDEEVLNYELRASDLREALSFAKDIFQIKGKLRLSSYCGNARTYKLTKSTYKFTLIEL